MHEQCIVLPARTINTRHSVRRRRAKSYLTHRIIAA